MLDEQSGSSRLIGRAGGKCAKMRKCGQPVIVRARARLVNAICGHLLAARMQDQQAYRRSQGSIRNIVVDNFKSYRGEQSIGPFHAFTAVIGPNGSGKSNLMDAISFVLGVRTNQLRGNQLKELLYANSDGNTEEDRPRRGFVKLVYVTEAGEAVGFSRHIQPSSSEPDATHQSIYKVNDRCKGWKGAAGLGCG